MACDDDNQMCQLRFPFQLHDMLQDAPKKGFEDVISWLPSGKSFKIHDQTLFQSSILPAYFSMRKYKSFQRQLHWYAFTRTSKGFNNETYDHKYFNRDIRHLCQFISRKKKPSKQLMRAKKSAANTTAFYSANAFDEMKTQREELFSQKPIDYATNSISVLPFPNICGHNAREDKDAPDQLDETLNKIEDAVSGVVLLGLYNKDAEGILCLENHSVGWMKAHEDSLLECALQIMGGPIPVSSFSKEDITNELISTFH